MTIVCVLDRGCNMGIPSLSSVAYPGFTTGPMGGDGSQISDLYTHGTYCAGIVARTYTSNGGSPGGLRIMPVALKNLTIDEVIKGIDEATKKGAKIISVSQEFPPGWPTADIDKVIEGAFEKNILVCVATGNANSSISYPATHPRVMAVGACTKSGDRVIPGTDGTWGSNFGSQLSVVALGVKVDTSYLGGRYLASFDKTSAAAPQVAGLAALILSAYPSLSNTDVRALIERNADHPNGGRNNDIGYGRINISRTMTALNNLVGVWNATGSLMTRRSYHTATLLPNGKVLVAGGSNGDTSWPSAELYDPATGTWSATGDLMTRRRNHTATLLPNGKVLVTGGVGSNGALASAELYDPATGVWSETGDLTTSRGYHTATLLPNGKVLVVGGAGNGAIVQTAELYDWKTRTWSATGSPRTTRAGQTILLRTGKVLVAGGFDSNGALASAELYDPTTEVWSETGALRSPRYVPTATLLPSGKVLMAGGWMDSKIPMASAELYDPITEIWSTTGELSVARRGHTAALLPNGKVLVAGGSDDDISWPDDTSWPSAELYDPATGVWSVSADLTTSRRHHSATLLPNGKVLVAGGGGRNTFWASAELFTFVLPAGEDSTPPAPPVNLVIR